MSDDRAYPRILIAGGDPIGVTSGTGITLQQMFGGWPAGNLAQACFSEEREARIDRNGSLFLIPRRAAPVDYLVRRMVQRVSPQLLHGAPANPTVPLSQEKRKSLRARLHMEARALADVSPLLLPGEVQRRIRGFQPDVVYSLLGSARVMMLARSLADIAQCPLVPHFMDDWITGLYTDGQLAGLARRRANALFAQVLKRSRCGLCISQPMAREYERRYHLPFHDFMNCVEDEWFASEEGQVNEKNAGPLRIVYCGGLHLGRDAVLRLLAAALGRTASDGRAQLVICAPEPDVQKQGSLFRRLPHVEIGSRTPSQVLGELYRSDVVVHAESFESEYVNYTRYSISTKIPQYLAAGKAVLAIGPAEIASMQHLAASGAAELVDSADVSAIARAVDRMQDPPHRRRLGDHGIAYARSHHSATEVRERLRRVLCELSHQRCAPGHAVGETPGAIQDVTH